MTNANAPMMPTQIEEIKVIVMSGSDLDLDNCLARELVREVERLRKVLNQIENLGAEFADDDPVGFARMVGGICREALQQ